MSHNLIDTITGALAADAAAMGLHWLYDQNQIQSLEATGDILFRPADANVYIDRKGFFAQAGKLAGELSHYGESMRLAGELGAGGQFTAAAYQQAFFAAFGPCGTFTGYADRPTKALIARIITDGDSMDAVSGASDNQMPGLCAVPGLFAHGYEWSDIEAAVLVISTHEDALAGARVLFDCLSSLADGASLSDALKKGCDGIDHPLKKRLQEAMGMSSYQPLQAAEHFGSACSVVQALPVVWHLLTHAADFESAVRDNIRCGGDNCGRAVALGAIAGLSMGVPEDMLKKLVPASLAGIKA